MRLSTLLVTLLALSSAALPADAASGRSGPANRAAVNRSPAAEGPGRRAENRPARASLRRAQAVQRRTTAAGQTRIAAARGLRGESGRAPLTHRTAARSLVGQAMLARTPAERVAVDQAIDRAAAGHVGQSAGGLALAGALNARGPTAQKKAYLAGWGVTRRTFAPHGEKADALLAMSYASQSDTERQAVQAAASDVFSSVAWQVAPEVKTAGGAYAIALAHSASGPAEKSRAFSIARAIAEAPGLSSENTTTALVAMAMSARTPRERDITRRSIRYAQRWNPSRAGTAFIAEAMLTPPGPARQALARRAAKAMGDGSQNGTDAAIAVILATR
jgi:hypothetical protein